MKDFVELKGPILDLISECSEVGQLLHEKDWAESNGGNLSIRIAEPLESWWKGPDISEVSKSIHLKKIYPNLSCEFLLLKGSGKRMRDIKKSPEENLCIGQIIEDKLQIFWPNQCPFVPTSELHSHLEIHNYLVKNKPLNKAILHTHPTELIALSFDNRTNNSYSLTKFIQNYSPGFLISIPEGIGYIKYEVPSSKELAAKTLELIETYRIIVWAKHGVICASSSLIDCFDLIDITNKSAKINLLLLETETDVLNKTEIKKTQEEYGSFGLKSK